MKHINTIQHTQSVHHTNGMVGSWTDWDLTDLGRNQADRIGKKLKDEFITIRENGYAVSHGEWQSDASGIGAPIFNDKGTPVGSISISGPTQRFLDKNVISSYAELLVKSVQQISRELGYLPGRY